MTETASAKSTVPKLFVCPITLEIMKDPTTTPCGHMFERDAIVGWLTGKDHKQGSSLCPICNAGVTLDQLTPCFPVKAAIDDYLSGRTRNKPFMFNISMDKVNAIRRASKKNLIKVKDNLKDKIRNLSRREGEFNRSAISARRAEIEAITNAVWARLDPLSRNYETIFINKDQFVVGRSSSCDHTIPRGEISGKHCRIYRVSKVGCISDFPYDIFLEDLSTNGTYINGKRQGKEDPAFLSHGDEISLGNRFTSQEKPDVLTFLEWAFNGMSLDNPEMQKLKRVQEFDILLTMDDDDLKVLGVHSEEIRTKLLDATKVWGEEHHLPIYKFCLPFFEEQDGGVAVRRAPPVDQTAATKIPVPSSSAGASSSDYTLINQAELFEEPSSKVPAKKVDSAAYVLPSTSAYSGLSHGAFSIPAPSPQIAKLQEAGRAAAVEATLVDESDDYKAIEVALAEMNEPRKIANDVTLVGPAAASVLMKNASASEQSVGFEPGTYMCNLYFGQVILTIKRVKTQGKLSVILRTTKEGTAMPGVLYDPLKNEEIFFPDGSDTASYLFKWKIPASLPPAGMQTVNFTLLNMDRTAIASRADTNAVLIIEIPDAPPARNHAPSTDEELLTKISSMFSDIPTATISNVIARERMGDANMESLENTVIKKVMWYRDLPVDDTHISQFVLQEEVPASPLGSSSSSGGGGGFEGGAAPFMSDIPTILRSELEATAIMSCLEYVRVTKHYMAYLSGDYMPDSTHHPSQTMAFCKEVATIVQTQLQPIGMFDGEPVYDQAKVLDTILTTVDNLMNLRLQSQMNMWGGGQRSSGYDVYTIDCESGMGTLNCRYIVIEDLNGLFGTSRGGTVSSLYGVFQGFGGFQGAEQVSIHLPMQLASSLTDDVGNSFSRAYQRVNDKLFRKNKHLGIETGAYALTALLRGNDEIHLAWLGEVQAVLFSSRSRHHASLELVPTPLCEESAQPDYLGYAAELTLRNPTPAKVPKYRRVVCSGDECFLILATVNFWRCVQPLELSAVLAEYCRNYPHDMSNLADYVLALAKSRHLPGDLSLILLKFTKNFVIA